MDQIYNSRRLWACLLAVAALVLRRYGVDLDDQTQAEAVGLLSEIATALAALAALWSRALPREAPPAPRQPRAPEWPPEP